MKHQIYQFNRAKTMKALLLSLIFIILFFGLCSCQLTNSTSGDTEMGKQNAIKYVYDANPIYVHWKKHYCPQCEEKMIVKYNCKIVNSESPEAKNYDFSIAGGDTYMVGDVEFRTGYFHCENCLFDISFEDMKKYEKSN